MSFKKLIGTLHLWLGLASGLVVLIIGITGCIYAFVDEIRPVVYHQRMYVGSPANAQALPMDVLKAKAQEALGAQYPIQNAEVYRDKDRSVAFRSRKINKKALLYTDYTAYHYRVYLNPYTAEVLKVENTKWEFFNLVLTLHRTLLLGHDLGGRIISWSVVAFVLLLISGIILWWPKNKAAAKQRVWFKWKDTTQWKRKNYDLHNIPGFYAMLIALMISLTGLVWAFDWFSDSVQWVANGGRKVAKSKSASSDTTFMTLAPTDQMLQTAMVQAKDYNTFFFSFPKEKKEVVAITARNEDKPRFRNVRYQFDQGSGQLLNTLLFADLNNGEKIKAMNYDIHTGSVLGLAGKVLAFFASLIAASLPVTGFIIWINRKKKKPVKKTAPASKKIMPNPVVLEGV
jgi:uncharacterized iron-regulated membrane protein